MARTKGSMSVSANFEVKAAAPLDARYYVNTKADLTDSTSWVTGGLAYIYQGIQVYVLAEHRVYILVDNDYTVAANWVALGSGLSDGAYATSSTLSTTIGGTTTVAAANITGIVLAKVVLKETQIYDAEGTVGIVTAVDTTNNNVTVTTITKAGAENIVEGYYNDADSLFYKESTYTTAITGASNTIYISLDTNKTYRYDGTIFERLDEETGQIIQVATMPTAAATENGRIVQFIGTTDVNYTNGYFYKCVEDTSTTPSTYKWENIEVQAGSGDSTAKYDYTTNITVGGIASGTSISKTDLLADIVKQMLVTVYYPTFTNPSASLTYSASTNVEVKSTLAATTGTVTYNAGAITLQGVKQNNRGGAATKYYFTTSGADSDQSMNNTTGTFSVPALTRSTKGSITITGKVDYAQGPQPKDSTGADYSTPLAAGSVTATKTVNFIQAFFYGKSATTTVSNFTGLSKSVTTKGQKTFSFTTNNEHMVMAYDASYGNLTSILDPNGFEVIGGWTKSSLTVDGFNYYVWVADSATTDTNASFTFKF